MASTNRKSSWFGPEVVVPIIIVGVIVFATVPVVGMWLGSRAAEQDLADDIVITPEVVEEPLPDVVIKVDNIGCVIAEVPVITYYVATDTVRLSIECDSDILFHYLPAAIEEVSDE